MDADKARLGRKVLGAARAWMNAKDEVSDGPGTDREKEEAKMQEDRFTNALEVFVLHVSKPSA